MELLVIFMDLKKIALFNYKIHNSTTFYLKKNSKFTNSIFNTIKTFC